LGANYTEVRYEDLVSNPQETLAGLSSFVGQELDHEQILKVGIGSVSKPNTSFGPDRDETGFSPVGRWKQALPARAAAELEAVLSATLTELGYALSAERLKGLDRARLKMRRRLYWTYFETKLRLKRQSLLAPLLVPRDLSWLN
jgi:hypothetical protein